MLQPHDCLHGILKDALLALTFQLGFRRHQLKSEGKPRTPDQERKRRSQPPQVAQAASVRLGVPLPNVVSVEAGTARGRGQEGIHGGHPSSGHTEFGMLQQQLLTRAAKAQFAEDAGLGRTKTVMRRRQRRFCAFYRNLKPNINLLLNCSPNPSNLCLALEDAHCLLPSTCQGVGTVFQTASCRSPRLPAWRSAHHPKPLPHPYQLWACTCRTEPVQGHFCVPIPRHPFVLKQ